MATGKAQSISIKSNGGLSESEIQEMVKQAEINSEADKVKRDFVDARNNSQAAIGAAERQIEEGTDLDQTLVDEVNAAKTELQTWLNNADATVEDLLAANTKLMDASMKLGQSQYAKTAPDDGAVNPGAA
jgi:molecular chaperone DnaK